MEKVDFKKLKKPYIIAEIGHNHQGNLENCKKLFLEAKLSGANAVKLQKRNNKKLYTKYETDTDIVEKIMINSIIKKQCNCSLVNLSNIPGKFDHKKLANEVDKGVADIGFFICPLPMKKIMSIADKGKIVPKKSTYFDPKPADGLVNLLMDI